MMKISLRDLFLIGVLSLVLISAGNVIVTGNKYLELIAPPKAPVDVEDTRSEITVINVKASSCTECSQLEAAIQFLSDNDVLLGGITNVEYEDASEIIAQYGIEEVPAVVVLGNLSSYGDLYEALKQ
ncbi:MAG: thioredoxin family protein, partial [Candidatus Altiarchaeota archaeon]|nr:thioredoxin family protein [Candidatus Altiarchaeota archaeon]